MNVKHRIPNVVIGEPAGEPQPQQGEGPPTPEQYAEHIRTEIRRAAQAHGQDPGCDIAKQFREHPEEVVPPGVSQDFLAGFFGGVLYSFGISERLPFADPISHALSHTLEEVAVAWERQNGGAETAAELEEGKEAA